VIKKTLALGNLPALHIVAEGPYESPSGASLAQFLLSHIIFSLMDSP
jgi:hypothetical protein